jgi:mono/diheme cytochrome c family protein
MPVRAVRVAVLAIGWLLAGPALAASGPDAAGKRALYERHCAGCHAEAGIRGARLPRRPPDLTNLGAAYGSPLPRARLLHHVLDARRRGGARICGDRDLWWGDRGHDVALRRRGTVLVVLEYLEATQQESHDDSAPPGPRLERP